MTLEIIESQVVGEPLRQSPRDATDLGGAMEMALRVTAGDFSTSTTTTTVELSMASGTAART